MAKSDGSVIIDTKMNTSGFDKGMADAKKEVSAFSSSLNKLGTTIKNTFSETNTVNSQKSYDDLRKEIAKTESQLDKLIEKQIKFTETGGNIKSRSMAVMEYDIEMARKRLYELREQLDLVSKETPKKIGKVNKWIENLKNSFNGLNKSAKKSRYSILKMLGTSILFSTVFRAISTVAQGFSEGIGNLSIYSKEANSTMSALKSSVTQLKNSFATAFMPLITTATPALTNFISILSKATNYVGAFFSALSGKTTYTKAIKVQEDYAESLDKTAQSAKDAQKYLSGLDEIQTYTAKESGNAFPEEMFAEEDIEEPVINFAEKIKNVFKTEDWSAIGNYLSDGIVFGLNSLSDKISGVNWEDIGESVGNFLEGLDWTDILSSVGSLIWDAINAGVDFYKGMFDAAPVETSIITAIALLKFTGLGSVIWNAMKQPIADYFTNNKSTVGKFFKDKISSSIPSALRIGGIITIIFAGVNFAVDLGKNLSKSLLERSNELFGTEFKTEFIDNLGLSDFLFDLGPKVFEEFLNNPMFTLDMWSQILFGYSSFSEMLDAIISESDFVNKANDFIKTTKERITSGVASVTTLLTSVIKRHIEPLFSKETWLKNMSGVKEAFSQVWKGAVNIAISLLNTFIDYINEKMYFKWDAFKDPIFGTELIPSGNVQLFTVPKIPYLATGAVLPPNAPFMAMVGDQKHGTNIEAPLDTIKQAVREVVGNNGGGKYQFTAQINRRTLFEEMIDEARLRQTTSGRNPFDLA